MNNAELALEEINAIKEKYKVELVGVVTPLDYFRIKNDFNIGSEFAYIKNTLIVERNEDN